MYWVTTGRRKSNSGVRAPPGLWLGPTASHAARGPGTRATRICASPTPIVSAAGPRGNAARSGARDVRASARGGPVADPASQTAASHWVALAKASRIRDRSLIGSRPVQRQADRGAGIGRHEFDSIHQLSHEKEAAPVLSIDRIDAHVDRACVEIEPLALV